MYRLRFVIMISVILSVLLLLGCGEKKQETVENKNIETIELSEILTKTEDFTDKNVTVKGNFFASCSDSCCDNEFILKDGVNQIKVFKSKELELPKMKSSQPIRISGTLKATAENPVILASSVEIIK